MNDNYNYKDSSGLININTLSPSSEFYYQVKAPVALNPSAFGCKIAFYDSGNKLFYHRENSFSHELHSLSERREARNLALSFENSSFAPTIEKTRVLVNWSKQGNAAYILEYCKNEGSVSYESVVLCLAKNFCFRILEYGRDFKLVNELGLVDKPFDEIYMEDELRKLGLKGESMYLDPVGKWVFKNEWFPKCS